MVRTLKLKLANLKTTLHVPLGLSLSLSFLLLLSLYVEVSSAQSLSPSPSLTTGSFSSDPPFGLPASSLADAIASSISNASFPTTGYNTSIPAGPADATGNGISGWSLQITVAANIPLTNASDSSGISVEDKKSKVTEAAVLSLVPPSLIESVDEDSWRVCAIVFVGGLATDKTEEARTKGLDLDGTCAALLPSECIQELQVGSVANGTDTSRGRECASLVVPDACLEYFGGAVGVGYGESFVPC
ncbi:unnamed protein product [Sordaria macrospora k-hell]|uniref:WGS project CABT00000000 data, contig 2.9 n=1 Tax=Sordaria macrospora (strain ATCC MYA-333 / DSM 997 / K(L3346) / K-hell) TaxID=771870 RepID=F7VVR0_SORMK|nr:uncharacterized protein SMAC_03632 [Sordaria macrospora k-hell]CCC09601.1 unnamed protein product [Sordaria macrospora k-hell]